MDSECLKVWLRFDESTTADVCGNSWAVYKTPSIDTINAFINNALQLSSGSYIYTSTPIAIGGKDFTVDFWAYPSSLSGWRGLFCWSSNSSSGGQAGSLSLGLDGSKLRTECYTTGGTRIFGVDTVKSNMTNALYHFAVCYSHAEQKMRFFVDGVLSYTKTLSTAIERANRYVFVGRMAWSASQYLIGSVDEFRIFDGLARWTENFTPPSIDDYILDGALKTTVYADLKRVVKNPPIEWRYENYGTADLLTVEGTTVTDLPVEQSKTGSAFYQPNRSKCFDIPQTTEIWIKCDVYTTADYSGSDRIRIYSEDANGINGWTSQTPVENKPKYQIWHNGTSQSLDLHLGAGKIRTIRVHMISGSTDGLIEVNIAASFYTYSGNVNAGNPLNNVYIQMDGSNILVSNLIISNAPIGLDENVTVSNVAKLAVDTKRVVKNTVTVRSNVERHIGNTVDFSVDTNRTIVARQRADVEFSVGAKRTIKNIVTTAVNAQRTLTKNVTPVNPIPTPSTQEKDYISIVDIYDIELRTGTIHICNTNADIYFEGNKYISIPIEREDISRSVDDIDEDVKISMADATTEQLQFIIAGFEFRGCPVRIRQLILPDSLNDNSIYRDCFYGYVDNPAFQNGEFSCTLRSRIPKVTVPRRTYQTLCNCKFGDSVCQMNAARTTGQIKSVISSNQITIDVAKPDNFWRNGIIIIEGESRMIQKSEGALITTFYSFFASVSVGLTFSVQRGCDKTFTTCNAFGNIDHFTGFPAIPYETIYR